MPALIPVGIRDEIIAQVRLLDSHIARTDPDIEWEC
jgi:hypothetical protein